jgi:hypothetical protein
MTFKKVSHSLINNHKICYVNASRLDVPSIIELKITDLYDIVCETMVGIVDRWKREEMTDNKRSRTITSGESSSNTFLLHNIILNNDC